MADRGVVLAAPAVTSDRSGGLTPALELDDIDQQLIASLLGDGRIGNRSLAASVGISEATVGVRLRRLVSQGAVVFTTLIDWEAAGYEWFAIARIRVEDRPPRDVALDLAAVKGCIVASVVFGDVDVLAYFLLEDRKDIHRLIQEDLAQIRGVGDVSLDLASESYVTPFGGSTFLARGVPPLKLPNPVLPLDDVDVGVLTHLLADGRQSSRQIARELGISEGTVRARMMRLTGARLLKPVAMVNPVAVGATGVIADISLHIQRDSVHDVVQAVLKLPEVVSAAVTVGSADVAVAVAVTDRTEFLHVVLEKIRSLPGVRSTRTLEMVEVVKFVPYFKRFG